jgi:Phosphotransferase enzyme family
MTSIDPCRLEIPRPNSPSKFPVNQKSEMEDLDHVRASDEDVVAWCRRWKETIVTTNVGRERLLASTSNILVKLNEQALVKFNSSVTASEAANQRYARVILGSAQSGVAVPEVFRYFEASSEYDIKEKSGYLIMEYVSAAPSSDLSPGGLKICAKRIANAANVMWQTTCDRPGPVDGGEPRGPMWAPDNRAYERFQSRRDMESWFNRALQKEHTTTNLEGINLVFCHLDLAPRNFLLCSDSTLYLLDWACAGFFPQIFEIWALRLTQSHDSEFVRSLLTSLPPLSRQEEEATYTLWQANHLNMLHNW